MKVHYGLIMMLALAFIACPLTALFSQDMDTLEGIYRQQYGEYTARQYELQEQIEGLNNVLVQIQALIDQVNALPTENYAQQADRYEQLQLLLPSAQKFSEEIAKREKQLDQIMKKKDELRSTILSRQSSLPIWWAE